MVLGQAPRHRVGGECRRRLMGMLSCAMDSSAAPSAALAAVTERPCAKVIEDCLHANFNIIFGEPVRVEVGEVRASPLIRGIVWSVGDARVNGDRNR